MTCSACAAENPAERTACRICGAPLGERATELEALPPGTRLAGGVYVIEAPVGRGGLGITYRAWDSRLNRHVAIKEFFPAGCQRGEGEVKWPRDWQPEEFQAARQQFVTEGQVLARFATRGIAQVHSIFEERGTAYLVLEYIRGETLAERLRREGPLPVGEAVSLGQKVLATLAEVHAAGIVHGDLKPENLLLCGDGRVVLVDFGSALGSEAAARRGVWVTPAYAPLEQYARTAPLGPYTDLYAVGATLYHALTGAPPPGAPERAQGVRLRRVTEVRPEVPRELGEAVQQALALDVRHRPQSAAELSARLERSNRPDGSGTGAIPNTGAYAPWLPGASRARQQRRRAVRVLTALGAVLVLAPLFGQLWMMGERLAPYGGPQDAPAVVAYPAPTPIPWDGRRLLTVEWVLAAPHDQRSVYVYSLQGEWRAKDGSPLVAPGGWQLPLLRINEWLAVGMPVRVRQLLRVPAWVLAQARQLAVDRVQYHLRLQASSIGHDSFWLGEESWRNGISARLPAAITIQLPPREVLDRRVKPCAACQGEGVEKGGYRGCRGPCGGEGWLLRCPLCDGDGGVSEADRRILTAGERRLLKPDYCALCRGRGWVRGAWLTAWEEDLQRLSPVAGEGA